MLLLERSPHLPGNLFPDRFSPSAIHFVAEGVQPALIWLLQDFIFSAVERLELINVRSDFVELLLNSTSTLRSIKLDENRF